MRTWPVKLQEFTHGGDQNRHLLMDLISKFCNLRGLLDEGAEMNLSTLVESCRGLEIELGVWATSIRAYSTVVSTSNPEEICEGYYHIYKDIRNAYIWNCYRCTRIMINELLVFNLQPLPNASILVSSSYFIAEYRRSVSCIQQLLSDIFASVPFHLGLPEPDAGSAPFVGGLLLIWPLYMSASTRFATKQTRKWAIRRLVHIGHNIGIQQALALAAILEKRKVTEQNLTVSGRALFVAQNKEFQFTILM